MNRYNVLPMAVKRFRRPNTSSHELQDLPRKAPVAERMCYFVVFKYLACDGYQNGHGRGIPKTNCTDPLCKPRIESVPGFCPECIAVSMRDDSSIDSKRKARKRRQAYNKLNSGNTESAPIPNRGPRIKYDEATRRNLKAQESDAQRADKKPAQLKRTNTSSTRRSGDSNSSGSGFGGYENCGRVRRPSQSYGGYSYKDFVVSEMKPRKGRESEEEIDRQWSPKPATGGFRALFKRL
ncbi:hypothetical protein TWF225_003244 [Orbilia oligospora]|uniref:Uncharacterized protein n=1 Tax=Orbilia oligospora TaxID=2813651 RepID=A0A7C8U0Z0_ORBOL|nr:hypothetical protein TWF751_005952 [Orbilia oligospora]KAF3188867.1 hypothetical protein TWF225_003244 [Orbilia oligospora]KAF3188868.1 hypothetical protein TWF225_003244 [Orbilia oligospora]KAF3262984.1 hypothetical protein TWF128_001967 [Orbilia oligospora]KAF3267361.1 hypothetical protein TWF217_000428 [Orbilia oligospora]